MAVHVEVALAACRDSPHTPTARLRDARRSEARPAGVLTTAQICGLADQIRDPRTPFSELRRVLDDGDYIDVMTALGKGRHRRPVAAKDRAE